MNDVADISQAYQLLTPVLGVSFASVLVCGRAALLRAKFHTDRDAGRADCHGGVSALAAQAVAAALDYAVDGHHSRGDCDRGDGRGPRNFAADLQPGGFKLPVAVCGSALIQFTSDRSKMGEFTNGPITAIFGWFMAAAIIILNAALLWLTFGGKLK